MFLFTTCPDCGCELSRINKKRVQCVNRGCAKTYSTAIVATAVRLDLHILLPIAILIYAATVFIIGVAPSH